MNWGHTTECVRMNKNCNSCHQQYPNKTFKSNNHVTNQNTLLKEYYYMESFLAYDLEPNNITKLR